MSKVYPQIDVSLLNERYRHFKKSISADDASILQKEVDDALIVDDEETTDDESSQVLDKKETLFAEDYDENTDSDYDVRSVVEVEDEEVDEEAGDEVDDEVYDEVPDHTLLEGALRVVLTAVYRLGLVWKQVVGFVLLVVVTLVVIRSWANMTPSSQIIPNVKSLGDISKSIQSLQWQINDANSRHKNKLHELRNYLDLKLDEVSSKFGVIDGQLNKLEESNKEILAKLQSLQLDGIEVVPEKIPVILDEHNNVQLLPEFQTYLREFISATLRSKDVQRQFKIDFQAFAQEYLSEVVNDKVGFMNKEEVLHLVTQQFQQNKRKLIEEIKTLVKPAEESIPARLIPEKQFRKKSKVNYALSSNGARIINYLSTPTFTPRTKHGWAHWFKSDSDDDERPSSPFVVISGHEDGFWKTSVNAQLGLKFLEPIYMSEFRYKHARVLNSALLTSCPQRYEVYVQSEDVFEPLFDDTLQRGLYKKVMECTYSLNGDEDQLCTVPRELRTVLVKSVIVRVLENYNNPHFTSLNTFVVHGLTRFDVVSVQTLLEHEGVDESVKRAFRVRGVRDVGDDEVV